MSDDVREMTEVMAENELLQLKVASLRENLAKLQKELWKERADHAASTGWKREYFDREAITTYLRGQLDALEGVPYGD